MEDNNNISLDVTAEQQLFAPSIEPSDIRSAQLDSSMPEDMVLPESIVFKPIVDPPLLQSIIYQATKVDLSEKTTAEVADVGMKLQVKFDPEVSYKKLEENVDGLRDTVTSIADNTQNKWIPNPSPASKFEERPSLEQTNLIFDSRSERFSQYPIWA